MIREQKSSNINKWMINEHIRSIWIRFNQHAVLTFFSTASVTRELFCTFVSPLLFIADGASVTSIKGLPFPLVTSCSVGSRKGFWLCTKVVVEITAGDTITGDVGETPENDVVGVTLNGLCALTVVVGVSCGDIFKNGLLFLAGIGESSSCIKLFECALLSNFGVFISALNTFTDGMLIFSMAPRCSE